MSLDTALDALHREVAGTGPSTPMWRWRVRAQLAVVRDALASSAITSADGWLTARAGGSERTRSRLQARAAVLGRRILTGPDADGELRRLVADLEHYRQRLHDLAYDAVSLELGGSE